MDSVVTEASRPTRRERARAATIEEIKQTALALMRRHGTTDVHFSDIAREMGMTPPALYRYFADRDELLTALITDAYDDLGRTVAKALEGVPTDDVGGRWLAGSQAYRRWANEEPQRFALIFGLPVPGYAAPEEGPTTEAARRAMAQLANIFLQAEQVGQLDRPLIQSVDPSVEPCVVGKCDEMGVAIPPATFQAMLHAWGSLHGFTSLEAYGHLKWMTPEARDALFLAQVRLAARASGLPEPSAA